jgi:PAS domain S-box-containing protein
MSTRRPIKVLFVEDLAEDAELLLREMRLHGLDATGRRVDTAAEYEAALVSFAPDLILSDYTLPGFAGTEALQIARSLRPDTPFIFVSGTIGEERAIQALKQGAVDYVLKENRARLVPAVERALRDAEEREARRRAQRELEASEERFRSIAEATQEWIWEIDAEGLYTFCSPAVEVILGYLPDQLIGKSCLEIATPNARQTLADLLHSEIAEERGWRGLELHLQHAAGGIRWLDSNALPLFDSSGKVVGYRGVARDITDHRSQQ